MSAKILIARGQLCKNTYLKTFSQSFACSFLLQGWNSSTCFLKLHNLPWKKTDAPGISNLSLSNHNTLIFVELLNACWSSLFLTLCFITRLSLGPTLCWFLTNILINYDFFVLLTNSHLEFLFSFAQSLSHRGI